MRISTLRPLLVTAATALVLAGCGSDDATSSAAPSPGSSSSGSSSAAEEAEPVVEGDTCEQLRAAGATGASFGPVQAALPKDDLVETIQEKLTPLQRSDPAADVADAWATAQAHLEQYLAAAQAAPAGGTVTDAALFNPGQEVTDAQDALTDWWFDTCA
ncbi:hypothetical protein JD79_02062 [Geodermatophilus normandii]|uniref:Uncharacterized protein n=1 Tax=Geodermatophilus normandii TaxID=1137989 RepID=A0A317QIK3_9ACTN|nr:hypothetical protein [Geodermatophilus normandii]PWW22899.1 hypothetical protein JD79_02062 [Geodermatophilus normandii]